MQDDCARTHTHTYGCQKGLERIKVRVGKGSTKTTVGGLVLGADGTLIANPGGVMISFSIMRVAW